MPKLNYFEDVNDEWILPTKQKLDPDKLPFLWKTMASGGFVCWSYWQCLK
ncbi:unnamed protein product [Cylicostephanus goldi]|uniref:Uncharacterized protein n=1 Tax=Cylicostephanus goldi TaxID=71465 RepID=A0A3P6RRQ0_CYLGO|nr:unnamed protein product [Cylicostephanus goldi]